MTGLSRVLRLILLSSCLPLFAAPSGAPKFRPPTAADGNIPPGLRRSEGQTEFLNPVDRPVYSRALKGAPEAAASMDSNGQRAIQEADLFKVGAANSKLLYLLNNYRGLQVVSFAKGAEQPELLGHAPPTGNNPDEMYFDTKNNRLIVLERLWYDDSGRSKVWSEDQSRLLIYDVSQPDQPRIQSAVDVKGEIADSRLVGDVLYVATRVRPNQWSSTDGGEHTKGFVFSFNVSGEIKKVDASELSLPINYQSNMNIVEVKEKGKYKYYLIAALSKEMDNWWWLDRQSYLEVVDISNPKGKIKPVMVVEAKGAIDKRAQTFIKDDTLIAVSNYNLGDRDAKARVAVETFTFPDKKGKSITPEEADFRQAWLQRELRGLEAQGLSKEALLKKEQELLADPKLGLKGVFVSQFRQPKAPRWGAAEQVPITPYKPVADSVVTVGDTTGQHADLQDVRVDGNLLYAFWVPANQIDPLDLFDISNPKAGVRHIQQLQFQGWVEHAFPFTIDKRQFVIGLGWVTPAVDNETNRRQAQLLLFEIIEHAGKRMPVQLAELQLSEENAYAYLQAEDKFFELRMTGDKAGEILFPFGAAISGEYRDGGKIVRFDFERVLQNKPQDFFAEGGFLVGEAGYIRRIFSNSEINRINSFSDLRLDTYADSAILAQKNGVVQASHYLELARNIRSYASLTRGTDSVGLQIISDDSGWGGWWYRRQAESGKTEVRVVSTSRPDSEKPSVISTVPIDGSYLDHIVSQDGSSLLIMTESEIANTVTADAGDDAPQNGFTYQRRLVRLSLGDAKTGSVEVSQPLIWNVEQTAGHRPHPSIGMRRPRPWSRPNASSEIVQLQDGRVFVVTGSELREVSVQPGALQEKVYIIKNGPAVSTPAADESTPGASNPRTGQDLHVVHLDGQLYLFYRDIYPLDANIESGLQYSKNFVTPLTLNGSEAVCGEKINVPGEPVALSGTTLVTNDTWVLDIVDQVYESGPGKTAKYREFETAQTVDSVQILKTRGFLRDMAGSDYRSAFGRATQVGNKFVYLRPQSDPEVYPYGDYQDSSGKHYFEVVGLNRHRFNVETSVLELGTRQAANLVKVIENPAKPGQFYGIIHWARTVQVLSWDQTTRPHLVKFEILDSQGRVSAEPKDCLVLLNSYSWRDSDLKAHYSPESKTLEFPQGLYGVYQIRLLE